MPKMNSPLLAVAVLVLGGFLLEARANHPVPHPLHPEGGSAIALSVEGMAVGIQDLFAGSEGYSGVGGPLFGAGVLARAAKGTRAVLASGALRTEGSGAYVVSRSGGVERVHGLSVSEALGGRGFTVSVEGVPVPLCREIHVLAEGLLSAPRECDPGGTMSWTFD